MTGNDYCCPVQRNSAGTDILFLRKSILYKLAANSFKGNVIVDIVDLTPHILTFFTLRLGKQGLEVHRRVSTLYW